MYCPKCGHLMGHEMECSNSDARIEVLIPAGDSVVTRAHNAEQWRTHDGVLFIYSEEGVSAQYAKGKWIEVKYA